MKTPGILQSLLALLSPLVMSLTLNAGEEIIQDAQGMPCHVYTPDAIDPDKTYQLMVGVHGAGNNSGKNAGGLRSWAQRGDVIVIGPSFQIKGQSTYQMGNGAHAAKLIQLFKDLQKKYKLHDKMFIHGFSGGSQFAHRFTMLHPEYVCGVSAHSGGSWATDGYGTFSTKARKVPFAVSCGEKDTGKAWDSAPYGRLEWFKRFHKELADKKFVHIGKTWPDMGHRGGPGVNELLRQCFQVATGLPGKSATETVELSPEWQNLTNAPKPKIADNRASSVPYVDPNKLARATRAAFDIANKETVPDEKLVYFMESYPPILWKDKTGSAKLLAQCQAAALRWKKKAEEAGTFKGEVKRRYDKFSNGLSQSGN